MTSRAGPYSGALGSRKAPCQNPTSPTGMNRSRVAARTPQAARGCPRDTTPGRNATRAAPRCRCPRCGAPWRGRSRDPTPSSRPPPPTSPTAPPPGIRTHFLSPKLTFCTGSSRWDAISTGRSPTSSDSWAILAVRFADLTAENVATARMSVPSAVARSAIVAQLLQFTSDRAPRRGSTCRTGPRSRRAQPAAALAGSRPQRSAWPGPCCARRESRWSLPAAG
jgi:hypothetical protein